MTTADLAPQELEALPETGRVRLRMGAAALVLLAAAAVGAALIFWWVDAERARTLRAWQARMGIVADSRVAAIGDWLTAQQADIVGLAGNPALQIYLTEIALAGDAAASDPELRAETEYLENLLLVSAERGGYAEAPTGPSVAANVARVGRAGLGIFRPPLDAVAATPGLPPVAGALGAFVAQQLGAREAGVLDLFPAAADGAPSLAFAAPVAAVQDDAPVGLVLGVKPVGAALYPLLNQPGATTSSGEAVLVRAEGASVVYLSPLGDGTPPFARRLARSTPDLAAGFALDSPGGFRIARDYRDVEVLVVSRAVPGVPWTLLYKVNRAEALADSDARLTRMLVALLLVLGLVAAGVVAAWWHGTSRRAATAAARFRDMARRFAEQNRFIRRLTDSQPNAIFIVDEDNRVAFANARFANDVGAEDAEALVGKPLANVVGPDAARRYERTNRAAREEARVLSRLNRVGEAAAHRVLQSEHVPLAATSYAPRGVLVVEQDITEAITQRERSERILEQLVETLLAVVDRRDPFAAHHSERVSRVAAAIAREMDLQPRLVDTTRIAGRLMNLGKILVPAELLTKSGRLSPAELGQVRDSLHAGADLLATVEFDGPVVETLRQTAERFDGGGVPDGLAGGDILAPARIIAVANAFVGMVSPRAHRPGLDFDTAVESLLADAGKAFDRSVVIALVNKLDNRGGRAEWADFGVPAE